MEWVTDLPLPSPKTLWEAKNRAEWESEYSAHCATHKYGVHTMGMLIDAHKQNHDPAKSLILDYWNSRADNLSSLLNLVASMG